MDDKLGIKKLLRKAGDCYYENKLLKAEHYCNLAYELAVEDSNPLLISDIIHNKALFFFIRKTFSSSIKYYRESIEIRSKTQKPNNLGNSFNGLGRVYRGIGDYQKALDSFEHSIEITNINNDENLAAYLFDLARLQKVIKNNKDAYVNYYNSIKVAQKRIKETKPEWHKFYEQIIYNCYNDLSEIELTQIDLQQSKHFHQQALQVLEHSKSKTAAFFEAYKRFEIPAKILVFQKEFEQAIGLFEKAEKAIIEEYQGFEVGKDLANIIHQIGDCYIQLKQYEQALETYQRAIKAVCKSFCCVKIETLPEVEDIYNKRSVIASLSYKASTWLKLYRTKGEQKHLLYALETYQLIATLMPLTRKDYVEENSKFQLAEETNGIFQKAIGTCIRLQQQSNNQKYKQWAFNFAESAKAIVLQEHIQANYAMKGVDAPIQQKDMDFRSKIAFYQSAINTNQTTKEDAKQISTWQSELFKCKEQYEAFQKEIESTYPEYYALKYANTLADVESLQQALPLNSALVEYFFGEDILYVFVLTRHSFEVQQLDLNYETFKKDMLEFKKLVEHLNISGSKKEYEQFKSLGHQLYQTLLETALQNLNGIERLIIIPDDILFNIPFEVLLFTNEAHHPSAGYCSKNLDYLLNKYAISYNYSSSLLLKTTNFHTYSHDKNFAGFAPAFEDLSNNKAEIKDIHSQISGALFLEESANFEHFKQHALSSKILHLSTHAKQNHTNHKLSEIQLADTTITNYHIENMKINAGLTVLSACETGTGLIQSGEGAMSLARSFFLAGCPSLVSSLWRADDESTADIMLYFYQYIKNGANKDVALQKAKLQYCAEAGILESHPFYWAGFVQSGNRKALF